MVQTPNGSLTTHKTTSSLRLVPRYFMFVSCLVYNFSIHFYSGSLSIVVVCFKSVGVDVILVAFTDCIFSCLPVLVMFMFPISVRYFI